MGSTSDLLAELDSLRADRVREEWFSFATMLSRAGATLARDLTPATWDYVCELYLLGEKAAHRAAYAARRAEATGAPDARSLARTAKVRADLARIALQLLIRTHRKAYGRGPNLARLLQR